MFLEDGKGSGKKALVNGDNRLGTAAIITNFIEDVNANSGQAFTIPLDAVAPSGATVFFYFLNGGETTYALSRFVINTSAAGVFRVQKVTGTAAGGTAVGANSLNLGVVATLDAITLQTGASITGLTEVAPLKLLYIPANTPLILDIPARIYLPPGAALALKAPGAATVNGTLEVYEVQDNLL